jgi:hypothetical protein
MWIAIRALGFGITALGVSIACSGTVSAEISVKRARDGAIVSMSNLSPANDCSPMVLRGRVSNLALEQGTVRGFTISQKGGGQYINVPALYNFPDPHQKAIARDGYSRLIRDGRTVTIKALFCGAAGRIVKMDAISTK